MSGIIQLLSSLSPHAYLSRGAQFVLLFMGFSSTLGAAVATPDAEMEQLARDYAYAVTLLEKRDVTTAQPVLKCLAQRGHARAQALLSSTLASSGDLVSAWAWRSLASYADPEAAQRFLDSLSIAMTADQRAAAAELANRLRSKFGPEATGLSCNSNRNPNGSVDWICARTNGLPPLNGCIPDSARVGSIG